jgi:sulfur carrier protein
MEWQRLPSLPEGVTVRIALNGETHESGEAQTLLDLLGQLGLADRRVAVLLDDKVVRKASFGETRLSPGCRVEIIQMVGGG